MTLKVKNCIQLVKQITVVDTPVGGNELNIPLSASCFSSVPIAEYGGALMVSSNN